MDFRDWKKISEDKKSCVLEHPKGHKLTVAIKGLSSIHREQLKRLKMKDGGEVKHYAQGTNPVVSSDNTTSTDQPNGTNITINAAPAVTPEAPQQNMPPMTTAVNPATQFAKQPVQATVPNIPQGEENVSPSGQTLPPAVNRNAQTAAAAQRDVDIAQAKADQQNVNQYGQALGNLQQYDQNKFNDMAGHTQAFAEYNAQNPINEKHYVQNMSAAGKTATALGIMIGGLGTPFGGHNVAYDYLNKQIDRDIEGQKSRADQQKTIYGAYKDLYGEGREASAATKASMLDIYNNKAKNIALSLGTPRAWANYLKFSNDTAIEKQKALRDGAANISALPGSNGNQNNSTEGASSPSTKNPNEAVNKEESFHVLSPKALTIARNTKYDPSIIEPEKTLEQYNKALQTDTVVDKLDDIYDRMEKNSSEMQNLKNHVDSAEATPDMLGAGQMAKLLTSYGADTISNRRYLSAYAELFKALRTAVPNAGDAAIAEVARANAPIGGDPADLVKSKKVAVKKFLRDNTEKGYLKINRMLNEKD